MRCLGGGSGRKHRHSSKSSSLNPFGACLDAHRERKRKAKLRKLRQQVEEKTEQMASEAKVQSRFTFGG